MKSFILGSALAVLSLIDNGHCALAEPASVPRVSAISEDSVEVSDDGRALKLVPGDRAGRWSLMAVVRNAAGKWLAVFEDFSTMHGDVVLVDEKGVGRTFPKSLEPTFADPQTLYRGHRLKDVMNSDHDLLGAEILAEPDDPSYAEIASCFAPITRMETYTFVGTRENSDKVGITVGGKTVNFDPAVFVPAIEKVRADGKVFNGLIGGWLPMVRFVYPEGTGDWSEFVVFAPLRNDNGNLHIQPVWYRVCRVEGNELRWAKYFDSYLPSTAAGKSAPPAGFYRDLIALREGWERELTPGMQISLPDERLANQARHSLVRAMMTRNGSFPKYGAVDRNYGGAEHDGFPDTFNVDTTAMLEWGLFAPARQYIDNYFSYFVRDDGSILYRGPETGQYGRMLTVLAEYFRYTGDAGLLLKHRARIDAVTRLLLSLRREAQSLPREHPAYGMIAGWCEADACLEPEPARYVQPYLSNNTEAVRGFADLGSAWERIGHLKQRADMAAWGTRLRRESNELNADLRTAIERSMLHDTKPACLPVIAGAKEPFDVAAARDSRDPQFRAYRANMEMLYSGCLTKTDVETIVHYREAHRDILLGVPSAYGYNSHELAGFLSYGHAYGLLQHDFVREFLLELYGLSAHQYTRGTWTAPETRRIDPELTSAPYCVPAQLSVPLLVRWMLAFEDPNSETLWLCKATPRAWLNNGSTLAANAIPTRWGKVGFQIQSHLDDGRIDIALDLPPPAAPRETRLRLRVPGGKKIAGVVVRGKPWDNFVPEAEYLALPASVAGDVQLSVTYE